MAKKKLIVDGVTISIDKSGYMSLTDLAKKRTSQQTRFVIQRWLRNKSTLLFLETWEEVNNENFNRTQMGTFRNRADENDFTVTPKRYIEGVVT